MNKLIVKPRTTSQPLLRPAAPDDSQVLRVLRDGLRADPPQLRFVARDLRLPQL
jgi:hypothetical protein